jgi:acetylornithine aminotransferase
MTTRSTAAADSPLLWYPGHELILRDIVSAEGSWLTDAGGKRYLDLESGVWCASLGHSHPRILRVIAEQSARIAHAGFNYTCAIVEEAAREILALLEFDGGKCVFLCSGSEAIEYGVRVAGMVKRDPLLLTLADSYFGAYGSASLRRPGEWFAYDWLECAECPDSRDCDGGCGRWASIPFDAIGGFLFEPGSSSGLVRFPPEKLIRAIVEAVRARGGFVLVNEVTTGVGRTGAWFGFQHYGIAPDFVALGKGIGNGYPVSVAACSPRLVARLDGQPVAWATSHQNDPLGAAVALEVVRVIQEERLIAWAGDVGKQLAAGIARAAQRTGRIRAARTRGLMVAVELERDAETSSTARVHKELVSRGYLVGRRPGINVLRIDPSLTIQREELAGFIVAFESVLAELDRPANPPAAE